MQRDTRQLTNRHFDVLVCGGGIYGAWTAYDAALRGLKVALVDKGDWGGATSSASSKLIHGGLRYLETFDFKLVKKSLAERQMLLATSPHRVWPLRFGVPVYTNSRLGAFRLKLGLALYDWLAGKLPASQRHCYHSKPDFIRHFPNLNPLNLKCGFSYFDAQTDDARLVLELVDGAMSADAVCVNYCEVVELIETDGHVAGAVAHDTLDDSRMTVSASQVVDTTGRWSANLQKTHDRCRLTKGIHLIMPKILADEALLLTAQSDGRVFFIIPWYGLTLLGTTDTNYQGDFDSVAIDSADIRYLLDEANHALNTNWTHKDIIGQFAGIRVLQQSENDKPSSISRDWQLLLSPNGLLSSIGGKLTSAREDSAQIVDTLCERLGNSSPCQTFGKPLPWLTDINYPSFFNDFLRNATQIGIDEESAHWLLRRHGARANLILQSCACDLRLAQRIIPGLPFIMADLSFCAKHEMVVHLDDLLRRRLPLLILAKLTEQQVTELAVNTASILAWDTKKTNDEASRCWQSIYMWD